MKIDQNETEANQVGLSTIDVSNIGREGSGHDVQDVTIQMDAMAPPTSKKIVIRGITGDFQNHSFKILPNNLYKGFLDASEPGFSMGRAAQDVAF